MENLWKMSRNESGSTNSFVNVGEGNVGVDKDGLYDIDISHDVLVPTLNDPISSIVSAIYSDLMTNITHAEYITDRAIYSYPHN